MPAVSIIIPVLDEAPAIDAALAALTPLRERHVEVVVVDGGSCDGTLQRAAAAGADRVLTAPRGRATQMNAGAAAAHGDVLVFLHVDTRLPPDADRIVLAGLARSGRLWGRFDVRIDGRPAMLRVVARMMNGRSRLTGIATGDQAIFVRRGTFRAIGGFPDLPLMEDVALSRRLKRVSRPLCLRERAVTSGRRWEKHGVFRTIVLMWRLRLAYALGSDPTDLARRYGYVPRAS